MSSTRKIECIVEPTPVNFKITLKTHVTPEMMEPYMVKAIYGELMLCRDKLRRIDLPFFDRSIATDTANNFLKLYHDTYGSVFPEVNFTPRPVIPYMSCSVQLYPVDISGYIYRKCQTICAAHVSCWDLTQVDTERMASLISKLMDFLRYGGVEDEDFSLVRFQNSFDGFVKRAIRERIVDKYLVDVLDSPELEELERQERALKCKKKTIVAQLKYKARCSVSSEDIPLVKSLCNSL